MYVDIVWWEAEDPETGLPVVKGGEYHNVCNLSFAPQTDLTGNSLPINQYTIDIITEDDIPTETVGHTLYDDRDFLWADWPITKVQRLAPNCVRVTASSWLHKLDGRQLEAVMYEDEPASDAIEACFGTGSRDYSINAAIAAYVELTNSLKQEMADRLADKDIIIAEKQARIVALEQTVADKDVIIRARDARILAMERQIANINASDLSRYPFAIGAAEQQNHPKNSPL